MLPGLLRVLGDNERQRRDDVRIFEIGDVHLWVGAGQQPPRRRHPTNAGRASHPGRDDRGLGFTAAVAGAGAPRGPWRSEGSARGHRRSAGTRNAAALRRGRTTSRRRSPGPRIDRPRGHVARSTEPHSPTRCRSARLASCTRACSRRSRSVPTTSSVPSWISRRCCHSFRNAVAWNSSSGCRCSNVTSRWS